VGDHRCKSAVDDQLPLYFIGDGVPFCHREVLINHDSQFRVGVRAKPSARTNVENAPDAFEISYKPNDTLGVYGASVDQHRDRTAEHLKSAEADEPSHGDGEPRIGIFPTCRDKPESAQNGQRNPDICGCMKGIGCKNL